MAKETRARKPGEALRPADVQVLRNALVDIADSCFDLADLSLSQGTFDGKAEARTWRAVGRQARSALRKVGLL